MTKRTLNLNGIPKIPGFEWRKGRGPNGRGELVEVWLTPKAFFRDGRLAISAEEGDGAADYYGEFRNGDPYIAPELENWAEEKGGYWDWLDPGTIVYVEER